MTTVIQGGAAELGTAVRTAVRVFEMIAAAGDKGFRAKVKELAEAQAKLEETQTALATTEAERKEQTEELMRLKAALDSRDVDLKLRHQMLDEGEGSLQARVTAADTAAVQRNAGLNAREVRIERQEAALVQAKAALDEMQGVLAKRG